MIRLFNKTITLLNRCKNADFSDTYYISSVPNVCAQVHVSGDDNSTNSNVSSSCSMYIHSNTLPKPYHAPKVWANDSDKSSYITFKQDDYIVIGEISETQINDINSIYNKYDNVFKIYSVVYYHLLDSFQIKAK